MGKQNDLFDDLYGENTSKPASSILTTIEEDKTMEKTMTVREITDALGASRELVIKRI